MTASCSVFLAVGQAIFQSSLTNGLFRVVSPEEAQRIIAAGAADVHLVVSPTDHDVVINVYNTSIVNVFVSSKFIWPQNLISSTSTWPLPPPQLLSY
jgi:tagatose-1,6-bisphosphate aldolase